MGCGQWGGVGDPHSLLGSAKRPHLLLHRGCALQLRALGESGRRVERLRVPAAGDASGRRQCQSVRFKGASCVHPKSGAGKKQRVHCRFLPRCFGVELSSASSRETDLCFPPQRTGLCEQCLHFLPFRPLWQ